MHTDELRTVERITRPNRDTLHYEATMTIPARTAEPWTIAWDIPWLEGAELAEYICQENNQFLLDLKDDFGNPFFEDEPTRTAERSAARLSPLRRRRQLRGGRAALLDVRQERRQQPIAGRNEHSLNTN